MGRRPRRRSLVWYAIGIETIAAPKFVSDAGRRSG
jgi:hypothetical protein